MKTTARGVILELTDEQQEYLDDLMFRYCAAVRWSFKRLLEDLEIQSIRKNVQGRFQLNSRQANDAVYEAQSIIKSQEELVQLNYTNALARVKFTERRLQESQGSEKNKQSNQKAG